MFIKALVVLAASAHATVDKRALSFDTTNNKVVRAGHALSDGNLVLYAKGTGGTAQAGLTDNTVYVVASSTTNDFQLKLPDATLAATGNAIALADTAKGTYQNTLSLVGTTKCTLKSSDQTTNKITTTGTCASTGVMYIYCTDTTPANCKLDGNANTDVNGQLKQVKIKTGDLKDGQTLTTVSGTDITIGAAILQTAFTAKPIFLLSKDSKVVKPVTTTTTAKPSSMGSRGVYALSAFGAVVSYILF